MKFTPGTSVPRGRNGHVLDATDLEILGLLQNNCKQPLASIGAEVGLSAPAVVERIHKLEASGVITGYSAQIDARSVGLDVSAFIGLRTMAGSDLRSVEGTVLEIPEVLECHHVTGAHSLLLKVKTRDTHTLEALIDRLRSTEGISQTETMVVLSSPLERSAVLLRSLEDSPPRPARRGGHRTRKRQARG